MGAPIKVIKLSLDLRGKDVTIKAFKFKILILKNSLIVEN